MCFSATASFTATAGLLIIGGVAIQQSKTVPQRVFSFIPLLFSAQQFSEGLLWVSLTRRDYAQWQPMAMYTFLLFAQVIWPAYVPLCILLFERKPVRKRILEGLLIIGILTSLFFSYCLLVYPSAALIEGHHIKYILEFPFKGKWFSGIPYILAAACSPFVAGKTRLRIFGFVLVASYVITMIMYKDYLVSVWCYFGAALSLLVIYINKQSDELPVKVQV